MPKVSGNSAKYGKTTKQHGDTKKASSTNGRSRTGKGVRKPEVK